MCFKCLNKKIKKMKWYDIAFIKIAAAAFILMITKLWTGILELEWYWYLVIGILASIASLAKMFKK